MAADLSASWSGTSNHSGHERGRCFALATEPFTIANGQMAPTLKIKRRAVRAAYGAALYPL